MQQPVDLLLRVPQLVQEFAAGALPVPRHTPIVCRDADIFQEATALGPREIERAGRCLPAISCPLGVAEAPGRPRKIPRATRLRYLSSLGRLTAHVDPTSATAEAAEIKAAADSLADLEEVSIDSLAQWAAEHPQWVPVLALSVGLSREKLRNILKHHFNTTGWISLAVARPRELVSMLDSEYDLVRLVHIQRHRDYDFGDILVARAGTRATATRAGASGRRLEDEIEAIARSLELPHQTRARFVGRHARSAPCDLAIPSGQNAVIVVAAKGFDSTGSKLTDAVREIEEMADVRLPTQFVMAVIDGIGWKSRVADLRRIYTLWANRQIDGMYSLGTLDGFREDLQQAAWLRGLKQA